MKRIYTIIAAAVAGTAATAQTLNVHTGSVCTAVQASDSHMAYAQQGTTLTVEGKTFSVNEIDSLVTNLNAVTPGSVTVTYANGTA